ncbi:MAG: hypothetical protein NVS3B12_26650 [Acidimicrobiales bacterium]
MASPSHYGDFVYPSPVDLQNSADVVQVRLAADNTSYTVAFLLQTMTKATAQRVVVGRGIRTAHERRVPGSGLGAFPHLLQIAPNGATLDGKVVEAHTDVVAHTLEARFPRSAVGDGIWHVAAAAGTWTGSRWGAVTDLVYVPDEPLTGTPNCWFDKAHSAHIASGHYPEVAVDTARLRNNASDPDRPARGAQVRTYRPPFSIGEGITGQQRYAQQAAANVYRGLLSPYTLYVPPSYRPDRPAPLLVLLHCLTCTHDVYFSSSWPGMKQLADARGALIVTPLAYGEGGHYEGEAEWDVFGVMADVAAHYRIDRTRLYLAGMSMGSLGTFRLGLLYPDLWARTFGIGNYTQPFCVTPLASPQSCQEAAFNYYDILANARNLPWGLLNGAEDELTPVSESLQVANRFDALGYGYRLWLYPNHDHDPSLLGTTADLTSAWLGDTRVISHPQRVTFSTEAAMDTTRAPAPDGPQDWTILHDRAYWLSGIRRAAGVATATVDAASSQGSQLRVTPITGSGQDAAGPYAFRGNDAAFTQTQTTHPAEGINTLKLQLSGVSSLRIDPQGAGLCPSQPIIVRVTTDTPVQVEIIGVRTLSLPAGSTSEVIGNSGRRAACRS